MYESYICPECRLLFEEDDFTFQTRPPHCPRCGRVTVQSPWFGKPRRPPVPPRSFVPDLRYWRVKTRLPERHGHRCKLLARGTMNSCLIEFEDGHRVITSRNYLRKQMPAGGRHGAGA